MTSMVTFPEILNSITGNINGDLFMFWFPALFLDRSKVLDFSTDKLNKSDMALTWSYSAHCSMITSTELFGENYLLTVGNNDQVIM